jgi:hypothetical protein
MMRAFALVLSLTATLAACASTPAAPAPEPVPRDESAFCAMRRGVCERQIACGVYLMTRAMSVESCLGQLACEAQERAARVSGVSLDEAKLLRCTAALKAASCAELTPFEGPVESSLLATNDDCATALAGTRVAGEACVLGSQCAEGFTCGGSACPGTCRAKPASCNPGVCPAGTFCDGLDCKVQATRGATCALCGGDDVACSSCEAGLFCQLRPGEFTGTCVDAKAAGSSCADITSFNECAAPNVCLTDTSRCEAPRALGETCSGALDCGRDARCDLGGTGTCAPLLPLGAACTNVFYACGPGASCVSGVCTRGGAPPSRGDVEVRATVGAGEDCGRANCGPNLACRPHGDSQNPSWSCDPLVPAGGVCEPESEGLKTFLMLAGKRAAAPCAEGVCDLFASPWRCVVPQAPGSRCSRAGVDLACASGVCANARCADFYACR